MPELPEVETVAAALRQHLPGLQITQIITRCEKLRKPVPTTDLQKEKGSAFCGVRRRAKYLLLDLDSGRTIIIHLGMSGTLRLESAAIEAKIHDHLDIILGNHQVLRFHDPRKFGLILLVTPDNKGNIKELSHLAPEPLSETFTADYLFQISRKRTTPIKIFIMDQRRVVGVGNIYACETLFRARIQPTLKTGKLNRKSCQLLVDTIKEVLSEAIATGGTTISDFHGIDGSEGKFALKLKVYGRTGDPCPDCGSLIEKITLGGRSTFFCPQCQNS